MVKYPCIADPPPWNDLREVGVVITINGEEFDAVPVTNAVTGDVDLGLGFEALDPYVLVQLSKVEHLGDLHGAAVVIGTTNYRVRNARPKPNVDFIRLILEEV